MNRHFQKGLTLIELLLAIGILLIIFALSTINLTRLPSITSQSSGYDLLISDLRSQQTKAMSGNERNTLATGESAYGIHFETTSYILFKGNYYSVSDPNNFVVNLDPNLSFTGSTFPAANNNSVVFSPGSGEVLGYIGGQDSISIKNSYTGEIKVVRLNKYGATY